MVALSEKARGFPQRGKNSPCRLPLHWRLSFSSSCYFQFVDLGPASFVWTESLHLIPARAHTVCWRKPLCSICSGFSAWIVYQSLAFVQNDALLQETVPCSCPVGAWASSFVSVHWVPLLSPIPAVKPKLSPGGAKCSVRVENCLQARLPAPAMTECKSLSFPLHPC